MGKTSIGKQIREKRKALGLTQVDLASKAGIATRVVHAVEAGQGNPKLDTLTALTDALKMPISDIFPPISVPSHETAPHKPKRGLIDVDSNDPDITLTQHGEAAMRAGLEIVARFSRAGRDRQLIVLSLLWDDPRYLWKLSADGKVLLTRLAATQTSNQKSSSQSS